MLKSEIKQHAFIVCMFEDKINKYDAQNLSRSILGKDISLAEAKLIKPYGDLLQKCHEKDPIETSKYLVQKAAVILNYAYTDYGSRVLEKGLNENNPEVVANLIQDWNNLKEYVASSESIMFEDHEPPSCLVDLSKPRENPTYIQILEKHLESLKKK